MHATAQASNTRMHTIVGQLLLSPRCCNSPSQSPSRARSHSHMQQPSPTCRPHPRLLSLAHAHARHAGPTTGPRTVANTIPCRPSPRPQLAHATATSSPALPPRRSRASTRQLCTMTPSCHAVVLTAVRLAYKKERSHAKLRHHPVHAELNHWSQAHITPALLYLRTGDRRTVLSLELGEGETER